MISKIQYWHAKWLVRRIEKNDRTIIKFKNHIKQVRCWNKTDTKRLNKLLNRMNDTQFMLFNLETGYRKEDK